MNKIEFKEQLVKQKNPKKIISKVISLEKSKRYELADGILELYDEVFLNQKEKHEQLDKREKLIINNCFVLSFLVIEDYSKFKHVLDRSDDSNEIYSKYNLYNILSNTKLVPSWFDDYLESRIKYKGLPFIKNICSNIGRSFSELNYSEPAEEVIIEELYGGSKFTFTEGLKKLKGILPDAEIKIGLDNLFDDFTHFDFVWLEGDQKLDFFEPPHSIIVVNGNLSVKEWINGGEHPMIFLGDVSCNHIKLTSETFFINDLFVRGVFYANSFNDFHVNILNKLTATIAIEEGCSVSAGEVISKRVISFHQNGFGNKNVPYYNASNLDDIFKSANLVQKEYNNKVYYDFKSFQINNLEDYDDLIKTLK
jgi:hypothetical protein